MADRTPPAAPGPALGADRRSGRNVGQRLFQTRIHLTPRIGQGDAVALALKQPLAQMRLQRLDLQADGGGGDAQLGPGLDETAKTSGHLKGAQGVQGGKWGHAVP